MQLLLRTQPLQKSTHPLENARTAAGRLGVASRAARLPTSNVAHAPASRLSPSSPLPAPGKFWRLSLSAQHTALRALSASHLERRRRREPLPRPRGPARGRREGRPLEVPAALPVGRPPPEEEEHQQEGDERLVARALPVVLLEPRLPPRGLAKDRYRRLVSEEHLDSHRRLEPRGPSAERVDAVLARLERGEGCGEGAAAPPTRAAEREGRGLSWLKAQRLGPLGRALA
mmetsp:Transcript_3115/g.10207  ORF Transcript_3115/g.10207 Transcript_3115/m.10207 type:complete len:230 (-) Transcript_3115:238-927(-)